jgi:hypothetical protein
LIDASGTALEITGVHVDFPVLESLTAGGIILRDGGTASVPMLAHGDGADFHVYDGVTLTLPALMTFDAGAAADGGALPAHLPESGQGDQPDSVRQQSGSPPGTDPGHVHLPHPCLEAILDQEQPPDEVAEPVDASGQSWFVVAGITCANTAAHDLAGRAIGNAVVRNCRFVRIGGGHLYNRSNPTRYGNGIEFWCACENNLVEGCQFAHVYDTAMTIQGPEPCTVRNMTCGPTGASSANSHRGLTRGFGGRRWLATR